MAHPWGYGPKTFSIPGGCDSVVQLNVPYRGVLRGINFMYADGANLGCDFEIFSSEQAARDASEDPESSEGESCGSVAVSPSAAAYSITGPLSFSNGQYSQTDLNIPYINRDGTPTNGVRRLWMLVRPGISGTQEMTLSMTIDVPGRTF